MSSEYFVDAALKMGADRAVRFGIEDIVFDPRTILKCMFGCPKWGKRPGCPSRPGSLKPWEYERVLLRYSWGIIIGSDDPRKSQEISLAIERDALFKGFYFAFSLSECVLCQQCATLLGEPCPHPEKVRPPLHSVGIDVFKTVRKFGLPIGLVDDPTSAVNWYSGVFIE